MRLANVLPTMIAAKTEEDSNEINVTNGRGSDGGVFDETWKTQEDVNGGGVEAGSDLVGGRHSAPRRDISGSPKYMAGEDDADYHNPDEKASDHAVDYCRVRVQLSDPRLLQLHRPIENPNPIRWFTTAPVRAMKRTMECFQYDVNFWVVMKNSTLSWSVSTLLLLLLAS